ncbi:hypothetical protein B4N89_45885 [Embleya scabrispora]|uniref:DUF742 domain-containing protein n=1 Tax=Embleya scabrispora TaxID=159449 RepID=A0A1T3NJA1_9ACTN|nr:DUF742 domain-containing protein [Embleya scabrispora]OPC76808.1 hypothetical protein B4N89_45885 [Embleya scabrispora]
MSSGQDHPVADYVVTRGRAHPTHRGLTLTTLLHAPVAEPTDTGATRGEPLRTEHRRILRLCTGLLSLAEVSAHLTRAPAVVKVLVADLIDRDLIVTRAPPPPTPGPDPTVMKAVLDGLRRL